MDNLCILWDLESGKVLKTLAGHTKSISALGITPDGKRALTGSVDHTCILWDLEKGKVVKTLMGHAEPITALCITPDGKLALTKSTNKLILWYLERGDMHKEINVIGVHAHSINMTPNGKLVLIGSVDGNCFLVDLQNERILKTIKGHRGLVSSVTLSPDGTKAITGSYDGSCIFWNLEYGIALDSQNENTVQNSIACISPDSKWALSVSSLNVYDCILWDLHSGKASKTFKGHTSNISSMCFLPDSQKVMTAGYDNRCILWDINSGKPINVLYGLSGAAKFINITPDGKHALTISDKYVYSAGSYWPKNDFNFWSIESRQLLKKRLDNEEWINEFCVSSNGRYALTRLNVADTFEYWDLENFVSHKIQIGNQNTISAICISIDNKLALIGSWNKTCVIWNLQTGRIIKKLVGHTKKIVALINTPDGRKLFSVQEDYKIIIWNPKTGVILKETYDFKIFGKNNISICISPDGMKLLRRTSFNSLVLSDSENLYGKMYSNFVLSPDTQEFKLFQNGVLITRSNGSPIILDINYKLLNSGPGILTIRKIWDFELHYYLPCSADCPLCGHRFAPPASVITTIENITHKAGLRPEQSPCLELPNEAWEDPGLLGNCPKCEAELKFNPFIAGGVY